MKKESLITILNKDSPNTNVLYDLLRSKEIYYIFTSACDSGIFKILENEKRTAKEIAENIETDPVKTEKLLNVLVSLNLLLKINGKYTNSAISSELLVEGKPHYQGNLIRLMRKGHDTFSKINKLLKNKTGMSQQQNIPQQQRPFETAFDASFILAMAEGAMRGGLKDTLGVVVNLPEYNTAKKLLDLGGGHGLYAIAFAEASYSGLESYVFDLPNVIPITKEYIEKYGMGDRVITIAGDITKDDFGNNYDIIFVSDVIYREKRIVFDVLRKIYSALNEKGILILKHWVLNKEKTGPLTSVLFDLRISLLRTSNMYTNDEYIEMLGKVGYHGMKIIDISKPFKPSNIIIAKKG